MDRRQSPSFRPVETNDRAFALAIWSDPRGDTPSALKELITVEDSAIRSQDVFSDVVIAARGFYPLEFFLFDKEFAVPGTAESRCGLVLAVARDIASNAAVFHLDWSNGHADLLLLSPAGSDIYQSKADVF